jgi:hypothetical protein
MVTRTATIPIVHMDTVQMGGITWHDMNAPSRDYNTSLPLPHIDGVLGFGAFQDVLLTLDSPHHRVRISRGQLPAADGKSVLDYVANHGIPEVDIAIGGTTVHADLDTGNVLGNAIHVAPSIVASLTLAGPARSAGAAHTVTNTAETQQATLSGRLSIGQYQFENPDLIIDPLTRTANIGDAVLKDFIVTFDQRNHRVRFAK